MGQKKQDQPKPQPDDAAVSIRLDKQSIDAATSAQPISMRSPDSATLIKVPRLFEDLFRKMDENGMHSLARGNGIYEIVDAPLDVVRDRIKSLCSTGTDACVQGKKDIDFLTQLGIDPSDGFSIDSKAAHRWINRWTLTGVALAKEPPPEAKVKIIFNPNTPIHPAYKQRTEQLFRDLLIKLATAAGLGPDEMPTTIEFVSSDFINSAATTFPSDTSVQKVERTCGDLLKAANDLDKINKSQLEELNEKIQAAFKEFVSTDHSGGTIMIPDALLKPISAMFYNLDNQISGKADRELYQNTVMSTYASLVAHEIGHILEFASNGPDHDRQAFEKIIKGLRPDSAATKGLIFCSWYQSGMLENLLQPNEGLVARNVMEGVKQHFHNRELDAELLGFYIALKAGYDPRYFGSFLLDDIPESITHPAEAKSKKLLKTLYDHARAAGLVK